MALEQRKWLTNVFDSEYFMFWMGLVCLLRYKDTAAHQYICYRMVQSMRKEIAQYYPQLFHLMLMESGSLWNRPIFRMIYRVSLDNRHFSMVISMYALSVAPTFSETDIRYRMCIECVQVLCKKRISIGKVSGEPMARIGYIQYLRMTYGSKVGFSPTLDNLLVQQREFYKVPGKVKVFKKKKQPGHSLKSIICALLSGVVSVFDKDQHGFLIDQAGSYGRYRTVPLVRNAIKASQNALNAFSKDSQFIHKLNVISNFLIPIPKAQRAQALTTELNLINLYLPDKVCLPVICTGKHMNILKVSVGQSKLLDSAARAPFMLVYECSSETNLPKNCTQVRSPLIYAEDIHGTQKQQNNTRALETKEMILSTAIKILRGLKDLDSSSQVDLDILSIKTKVIKKIYDMHTPAHIPIRQPVKHSNEWINTTAQIKESSIYKQYTNWNVQSIIVKTGSDMKQEHLTTQVLQEIKSIWETEGLDIFIRPHAVLVTGKDSGLIETITGARSIHQIKRVLKEKGKPQMLLSYFNEEWEDTLEETKEKFFKSLVGYSLVSYILQIKDRHNGNILIDQEGRMVHIDFGFVLGSHPGFYSVESAPFKFSVEYAEIVGPERMNRFRDEFHKGFISLRKNMDQILTLVSCIAYSSAMSTITTPSVDALRERFKPGLTEEELSLYTTDIVARGIKSVFTDIYDSFQYYTQGYCR
ncbi:phosphatidylinositol 4-kinase B [Nematocida sp. AWRm80]|nr:phosphatidylinositol 4-kinase B [Nematocida sp. AWRm80]